MTTNPSRSLPAAVLFLAAATPVAWAVGTYKIIGWNDLGMHCVDGNDYSVFSILPPYNNLHAQVVGPDGKLIKSPNGLSVTYEAVADPTRSINRTSTGKTNFWNFTQALFHVTLAPDMGLAGNGMPGETNRPQRMPWNATNNEFKAACRCTTSLRPTVASPCFEPPATPPTR